MGETIFLAQHPSPDFKFPCAVVEVEPNSTDEFTVVAPPEFRAVHPVILQDVIEIPGVTMANRWQEVPGPARMMNPQQNLELFGLVV